jgi:hypothetical protein
MFRLFVGVFFFLVVAGPLARGQDNETTEEIKKTASSDEKPPNFIYGVQLSPLRLLMPVEPDVGFVVLIVLWRGRKALAHSDGVGNHDTR